MRMHTFLRMTLTLRKNKGGFPMKKQFFALLLAVMMAVLCMAPAMAETTVDTINYENGDVYVGEIVNGQPNGVGIYTLASGKIYRGEFVDGCFHGNGTYIWTDGMMYVGEFNMDVIEGKGVVVYADGEYYIGEFSHNKCHGYGTTYSADGKVLEAGMYDNGTYMGPAEEPAPAPAPAPAAGLTDDDVVGTWVCAGVRRNGTLISADMMGLNATMTFKADGSCRMTLNGEEYNDKWYIDAESGRIAMGSDLLPIINGELLLEADTDSPFVFIREEAEIPAAPAAPAASGASQTDVVGKWVLYAIGTEGDMMIAADYGLDSTMTFNEDGTCVMTLMDDVYRDTWSVNEEGMLVMGGDSVNPIINGEIHLDLDGVTAIFVRP